MLNDAIVFSVLVNMGLCIVVVFGNGYACFRLKDEDKWSDFLNMTVGLLWLLRYILLFADFDSLGITYTNPVLLMLFTLTLTSLATATIIRIQKQQGITYLKQDIQSIYERFSQWKSKK